MPSVGAITTLNPADVTSQANAPAPAADVSAAAGGTPVMGDLPLERVLTARLLASIPANLGQNYDLSG